MFIGDLFIYYLSFALIILIRFGRSAFLFEIDRHFLPFLLLYITSIFIFYISGLYDIYKIKPIIPNLKTYIISLSILFIIAIIFFYFIPFFGITPKTNLLYQIISYGILSFTIRRLIYNLYSSSIYKPVILVGNTNYMAEISRTIKDNPQIGLKIISEVESYTKIDPEFLSKKDLVLIVENNMREINQEEIIFLYTRNVEVIDITKAYEKYLFKIPIDYITQTWIIENINVNNNSPLNFIMRFFDILLSIFILLLVSPILLITAIFIYLGDNGNIFYTQERVGLNGKRFIFYKFRSMIMQAETKEAVWAKENDTRITKVGKIIRKLHIDEIPQMINILKGDMALVGPRPERPDFVKILEDKIPNYGLRHIIKPGFTGWAQIKYRYARTEADSKDKFEYDLYYIKNNNIFMDLGIILRTIQIIFTH